MGNVRVRAVADDVFDNGVHHARGDEFDMEQSLVAGHVAAGQVAVVDAAPMGKPTRQQASPRDKQVTGAADKTGGGV